MAKSAAAPKVAVAERLQPLAGRIFAENGVTAKPAPAAVRIALRADAQGIKEAKNVVGFDLPAKPKTSATKGERAALWIGPDEWLVIDAEGSGIAAAFSKLGNANLSAVDVSHRNMAILLEGDAAHFVLNSGCPLDLSLAAFPVGACARTILSKSEIVLHREAEDRFRIECWRSFSDYVWKFLVDSIKSV
jgi:sarcosine oxidase, subunit gamma